MAVLDYTWTFEACNRQHTVYFVCGFTVAPNLSLIAFSERTITFSTAAGCVRGDTALSVSKEARWLLSFGDVPMAFVLVF